MQINENFGKLFVIPGSIKSNKVQVKLPEGRGEYAKAVADGFNDASVTVSKDGETLHAGENFGYLREREREFTRAKLDLKARKTVTSSIVIPTVDARLKIQVSDNLIITNVGIALDDKTCTVFIWAQHPDRKAKGKAKPANNANQPKNEFDNLSENINP